MCFYLSEPPIFRKPSHREKRFPVAFDDMAREDAQEGRISLGKSRKGDAPDVITLTVSGKFAYDMQQFFEAEASKGGDFCRVRWMVLLAEQLRQAVIEAREDERRKKQGR